MKASVTIQWDSNKREYYLKTIDNAGNSGTVLILPTELLYNHILPKVVKRQAVKLATILELTPNRTAYNIALALSNTRNKYTVDFIVQEYRAGRLSKMGLFVLPLEFHICHEVLSKLGIASRDELL